MIPTSLVGVILFLVFLSPGLIFNWAAERRRPEAHLSALNEIGRILVISTVASVLSWTITALSFEKLDWVDVSKYADEPEVYLSENFSAAVGALVAAVSLSWGISLLAPLFLVPKAAGTLSPHPLIWDLLCADIEDGEDLQVLLILGSGSTVFGYLENIDVGMKIERPMIHVGDAKVSRPGLGFVAPGLPSLLLPLDEVNELWVQRIPSSEREPPPEVTQ